jgi:NAD(P)-dependent dehydrogenase (short-subunit alcohol dehydrogenase family)
MSSLPQSQFIGNGRGFVVLLSLFELSHQQAVFYSSRDGVGYHIAYHMALHGATVFVGARNVSKAKDAIQSMQAESRDIKEGQLKPLPMDLGNLEQVYMGTA